MAATIGELRSMVERMETRLAALGDPLGSELLDAYWALAPVFAADLGDEREELLSRMGALTLIQQTLLERGRA